MFVICRLCLVLYVYYMMHCMKTFFDKIIQPSSIIKQTSTSYMLNHFIRLGLAHHIVNVNFKYHATGYYILKDY